MKESINLKIFQFLFIILIIPFIVNSTFYQANGFNDVTDTKTEVYNLSFNEGSSPFSLSLLTNANVILEVNSPAVAFLTGCIAGGTGSNECSMEAGGISCSVGFGEGYYSCCSLTSGCQCEEEDDDDDDSRNTDPEIN